MAAPKWILSLKSLLTPVKIVFFLVTYCGDRYQSTKANVHLKKTPNNPVIHILRDTWVDIPCFKCLGFTSRQADTNTEKHFYYYK